MIFFYTAFGLTLKSNLPIPGLPAIESSAVSPEIQIHLGSTPGEGTNEIENLFFSSPDLDEFGKPNLEIRKAEKNGLVHLVYWDGVEFWLDALGREIWAIWPSPLSIDDAATYLLGPVFGLLLRLRGVVCLHASAVVMEGQAIAFVGTAGAGKSTTAAALAQLGWKILADDIVALREEDQAVLALPSFPYLSLWPRSVDMLYGSCEALPRFTPHWEKRRLALDGAAAGFASAAAPLRTIYLLGERSDVARTEEITAQEALVALVANTYATVVVEGEKRAREFDLLGRIVSKVPVRRLSTVRNASRIAGLCDLIRSEISRLSAFPVK